MTWITLDQPDWLTPERFLTMEQPMTALQSLREKLTPEQALSTKLALLDGITPLIKEPANLSARSSQNIIELLADPQINGNLVLAFLHHQPASSPLHEAVLNSSLVRQKIL